MQCAAMRRSPNSGGARPSAMFSQGTGKPRRNGGRSLGYPRSRRNERVKFFQFLKTANHRRHWRIREAGLPVGDADFADIDVALRIQRDAVRREEFAGLEAGTVLAAEPGDALSLGVDDAQARAQIRHLAIDRHAGAKLANDEIRLPTAAAMQRAGPVQIIPLRLVSAVAVEHLHAMVLAVRDIDPAIGVSDDVVDDIELAEIDARLAPGFRS